MCKEAYFLVLNPDCDEVKLISEISLHVNTLREKRERGSATFLSVPEKDVHVRLCVGELMRSRYFKQQWSQGFT